jgi:hypothetical protein
MEIERLKNQIMFDILPGYAKNVGPCFTKEKLKEVTEGMIKTLVALVFPESAFPLRSIEETRIGKELERNLFYNKFEQQSD